MEPIQPSKNSVIKIGIAVIPAILILSICIALYLGANEDPEPNNPIEGEVTVSELEDYLNKLNGGIQERGFFSDAGIKGLRQTASMVKGSLGPENLGYRIHSNQADSEQGLLWDTIWIDIGEIGDDLPLLIALPYGEGGTPVAFALGFAEYLTSHPLTSPLRIVFYPPIPTDDELKQWVEERSSVGQPAAGFLIVRGGGPGNLWASISSPRSQAGLISGLLGKKGWEGNAILEEIPSPHLAIKLGEQGDVSGEAHAQRLLRVMPLLKNLLDELAD